jgi:hypothetical protein
MSAAPADRHQDQVRITGTLHADAELRYIPGETPAAMLCLEIHPAKGLPYRARQMLGTDPTAHMIAGAKRATLKRGTTVAVYAKGMRATHDHDMAVLLLIDVTDVMPLTLPPKSHHGAPERDAAPTTTDSTQPTEARTC